MTEFSSPEMHTDSFIPVMPHKMKVFIDFDGTITLTDTGEEIFRRFGSRPEIDEIIEQIRFNKITGKEGWSQLFANAPKLRLDDVHKLADEIQIDRYFESFVNVLNNNKIPFYILSDGFENYISKIFNHSKINNLKVYANKLIENEDSKIQTVFPYTDEECSDCANCKRNHILENSADDEFTVYIGNGSSDTCPAQFCDYVFAKDDLLRFCNREKITCFQYSNFAEVERTFTQLLAKRRLKKKHQAVLKRNEIYKLG